MIFCIIYACLCTFSFLGQQPSKKKKKKKNYKKKKFSGQIISGSGSKNKAGWPM